MKSRVTVLIPTFNRSGLLRRAIRTVTEQTLKDLQLVISDNASTDETAVVVANVMVEDDRVHYFRHDNNIGMLGNWASLINRVDTEYFCVLSDDDLLLPEFLEKAAAVLSVDAELGMCFGRTVIVDSEGLHFGYAPTEMKFGRYIPGQAAVAMVQAQHPASTGTLFRTSSFKAAGGFDLLAHYVADLDIMLRVAARYPIVYLEDEVAFHVAHIGNSFKDGSSWFPGLFVLLRNVRNIDELSDKNKNTITKCLVANAIFSALFLQFIRYPISTWRTIRWRCALKCVATAPTPWIVAFTLPIYLLKQVSAIVFRSIRSSVCIGAKPSRPVNKHQRHPRIDALLL